MREHVSSTVYNQFKGAEGKARVKSNNVRSFEIRKNDNYAKKLKSRLRKQRLLLIGSVFFVGAVVYRRRPDLINLVGKSLRSWSKELRVQVFAQSILIQVKLGLCFLFPCLCVF